MTSRILETAALVALALAAFACNGDDGPTPTPSQSERTPTPSPSNETLTPRVTPAPAAKGWRTLAPMPTPRSEVAVAAVAGKIYVVGGFEGNGSTSDAVEVYDPSTDTWTQAPPLPEPRHHTAAVGVADIFLYVIGGFGSTFSDPQSDVYRFDTTRQVWEERAPVATARGGHAVAAAACPALASACLYAIGGSDATQQNVGDLEVYDLVVEQWQTRSELPSPRDHLAAATVGDRIYAVGGRIQIDFGPNVDVNEIYDPSDFWTRGPGLPTARSGIAAASLGGRVYVFGGEESAGTFDENEAYEPGTNTWETFEPMPTARHGLGAAVVGDTIYVIGGGETPGLSVSGANEAFTP